MRIKSVHLKNFKRFSDLLITDIPVTARLVVVIGPNGSGKSSLFDAFLHWYRLNARIGFNQDNVYYRKLLDQSFDWNKTVELTLHDNVPFRKGCMYVRSAYRNDPDFSITAFQRPDVPSDAPPLNRIIDNDQMVSKNYQRLVYETMMGVYNNENTNKSVGELREELIGQVRMSLQRVLPDLELNGISSDPLVSGTFYFQKGIVQSYHYKNLSGGEKAVFDLLLDLHLKRKFLADAIYCIDEMDTHIHTRVQGTLLREMVEILPPHAQLWVTTHSLGVLRAAQAIEISQPGSVSLIDFDFTSDVPHELKPCNLDRVTWDKFMTIALDDFSDRIAPKVIIVCEGSSHGSRRKDFDAEIYNRILGRNFPDLLFVSGGSSQQLSSSSVSLREVFSKMLPNSQVWGLSDRDDLSEEEVTRRLGDKILTLPLRNLESYMFADDVLKALVVQENQCEKLQQTLEIKQQAIANSVARNNPADDLKSAAGEIYNAVKQLLGLKRCGNNSDTFMRDTLATLITPDMTTYAELKAAIVDKVL